MLFVGVGIWGIIIPVGWGFDIINFVWWIGIGHAGTLISAILLLLNKQWRTSINRFAEAMTLFAVSCAGLYPLLHMGTSLACLLVIPLSEYDVNLAKLQQPLGVGCVCSFNICNSLRTVLVCWSHSGFATLSDRSNCTNRKNYLWNVGHGLARIYKTLAPL